MKYFISTYIKKYKLRIFIVTFIFFLFVFVYMYITSYLEEVIRGNVFKKQVDTERSVTGDEIALTYTKDSGVVISYSAQRTQTEDDTLIIQSYSPRLIYNFPNDELEPVHIRADFGTYNQKTKIIIFEQGVVVRYATSIIKAPFACFVIDKDQVIFSQGAVIEDINVIKAQYLDWNIQTNTVDMKFPTIYIEPH